VARRAEVAAQMASRAAFVEATADQRAQESVEDERRRIARELHDLVAHAITVMVLQAAAAEAVLSAHPDRARDALATVQGVGRGALVDMKRLLGVLRATDAGATLAPQPSLRDLDRLVEQLGAAGLPVSLSTDGDLAACPDSVATSAFQIVREALTNTLRHAGPARAVVRVRCDGHTLDLEVLDDGGGDGGRDPGYGLVGMRERVAAFGGQIQAGTRPEGGYGVRAMFPFGEPAVR
jgi:signal transduction histidine kinase